MNSIFKILTALFLCCAGGATVFNFATAEDDASNEPTVTETAPVTPATEETEAPATTTEGAEETCTECGCGKESASCESDCADGKECGDGKCGDGKCGDKDKAEECGDGKCGVETKASAEGCSSGRCYYVPAAGEYGGARGCPAPRFSRVYGPY